MIVQLIQHDAYEEMTEEVEAFSKQHFKNQSKKERLLSASGFFSNSASFVEEPFIKQNTFEFNA